MSISHLFNVFIFTSMIGWVYECMYCTVKTTRWQNRGFLFGPVCPIYGLGFIGAFLLFSYGASGMPEKELSRPMVFLVCALGSAVLEYSTSFLLEKLFHARWWDYSKVPFNINGRICLPATLGFGVAGVVIIGYIIPYLNRRLPSLSRGVPAPVEETLSLVFMCVLGVDLGLSISSVTSLLETLERISAEFDDVMESRYEPIGKTQRTLAGKIADAGHAMAGKLESAGEYRDVLKTHVGKLSYRQVNVLMNIETFSSSRHRGIAGRMKEILRRRRSGSLPDSIQEDQNNDEQEK